MSSNIVFRTDDLRNDPKPPSPYERNLKASQDAWKNPTPSRITKDGKPDTEEERADAKANPVDAARERNRRAMRDAWKNPSPGRISSK